ncbi:MAG TPA: sulfurtransferase [Chloroflexota bacterium]|nr:sulfurtransferase [Chloroflexota bacterium]
MAAYTHPELLAETDWLAAHLSDPNLRIVDCRYYFDGRDGHQIYLEGHLPGAVHASYPTDLSDPAATPPNLIPRPEQFAATLARLGISNDTLVVGYDDEGGHYTSRLWWLLAYYGHDAAKVLNGGLVKWRAEQRPLASGPVAPPAGRFTPAAPRTAMRVLADDLHAALGDPGLGLLDVRRVSEYTGEEVRAARGGRIPGAKSLFWQENLNPDWTFRSADEIRARHVAIGATPDRALVTYCQGGVRAAHAALALRLIGYDNVRMYDGSWAEWGNRPDLPVEK